MAKTLEEIIGSLYGEKDSLTKAEIIAAANGSGMKIADLSEGDFVLKAKFDDHEAKYKKLQSDFDALQKNPSSSEAYKTLLTERDDWKTKYEKQNAEVENGKRANFLNSQKVKPEFTKFLLSEIEAKVTDSVDFETAAKKYLADNKQYIAEAPRPSGLPLTGGKQGNSGAIWDDLEKAIRS